MLVFVVFSLLLFSCVPAENTESFLPVDKINAQAVVQNSKMKIEVVSQLPWEELDNNSNLIVSTPQIATLGNPQNGGMDALRAAIQQKSTPSGNIALRLPSMKIILWDSTKKSTNHFQIQEIIQDPTPKELVDFEFDAEGNLYVLLFSRDALKRSVGYSTLAKIDSNGQLLWKTVTESDLKQTKFKPLFRQVLLSNNQIFLVEVAKTSKIYSVDSHNGALAERTVFEEAFEDFRMDENGNLYYVSWEQSTGLRYWIKYSISENKLIAKSGNKEAYPYLAFPFAVATNGDAYCYFGKSFAKLDAATQAVKVLSFSNILLDPSHSEIITFESDADQMQVSNWKSGKVVAETTISGAAELAQKYAVAAWNLVMVREVKWVFRGFSKEQNRFVFLDYDPNAAQFAAETYNIEDQTRFYNLEATSNWGFESQGNLLLGLSGPENYSILRISGW